MIFHNIIMQIITVERYLSPPTVFVVKIGTIFNNIKKLRNHVAPNLSMLVYMIVQFTLLQHSGGSCRDLEQRFTDSVGKITEEKLYCIQSV